MSNSSRFKDEGEVLACFGQAQLIKYLDGKLELKNGSNEDRKQACEWIALFLPDERVVEG